MGSHLLLLPLASRASQQRWVEPPLLASQPRRLQRRAERREAVPARGRAEQQHAVGPQQAAHGACERRDAAGGVDEVGAEHHVEDAVCCRAVQSKLIFRGGAALVGRHSAHLL